MYVCQFAKLHDENVRLITRRQKFCDHQESAICVKMKRCGETQVNVSAKKLAIQIKYPVP